MLDTGSYYDLDRGHEEHPGQAHHHHDHDQEHGHECSGQCCGPLDPHFWLDPELVREMILPRLFDELAALMPEHKGYFMERLHEYERLLSLLHEEITGVVSGFEKHDFISFHSAWQYFAKRYGLQEVAVVAVFPGQEPSSGWVARLVDLIKDKQIGAILTEPQFSPSLVKRIAEEAGIKVVTADPLGGENVSGRESYLELMRFNLNAFKEALD